MNQVRTFLLFAWILVGFLIWEAWQRDYAAPPAPQTSTSPAVPDQQDDGALPPAGAIPEAPADGAPAAASEPAEVEARRVVIQTDVLRLEVDTRGASIVQADLLAYGKTAEPGAEPVRLLDPDDQYFTAQSGWVSSQGEAPTHQSLFSADQDSYRLADGEQTVEARFTWQGASGLMLERTIRLERGSYTVAVDDRLLNQGAAWKGSRYHQLLRVPPPAPKSSFTNPEAYSFVGAAWYSDSEKFNKIAFDDFDPREPLNETARQGWVAMLQHYFFAAWIPAGELSTQLSTGVVNGRYLIRSVSPPLELAAGAEQTVASRLYVGPKLQEQLADLAPGLELAVDYGIFTIIAEPLFWLLSLFHALTGNWGWAIILLVVLIKLLFFKLSETQYKSFARMRQVQPRIEALKERYGDDRQKFNMAMMELYKKEKINPMGGCLPILVQIPVFISLYWVLLESVELRHAPWIGWIQNLTAPDPYFILPILNLLSMWLTQKLSPTPGMDPLQKKMMQAMPLVFGVLFAFFPAGLVLYWTVNGALGLLQQWVITRRHGEPKKA
ncbi:membrane protein insertase YidC [Pseudomarimonas salicorniae]|uniref:Membrane protein insertase YidC n=1 Tax=Pseudomarimonas salicorniae TaxID=2933270 RepID=A0ABT0GEL0_9GAMM|nr:membrane protein insertase YidC [Lysobacter sp. CAU 1642]MCK7592455.1 membrane protein insertase YidC [Lysobacter sp. CAU 1642]